jgi:hypothetical protein
MGLLSEGIVILKKYHRHILLGSLGLLFVLDIVTTTVALERGNSEQNPFMIPLVQDPVLHLAIKVVAYVFLFIAVERAYHVLIRIESRKKRSSWERMFLQTIYALVILALVYLISFYVYVVAQNSAIISSGIVYPIFG